MLDALGRNIEYVRLSLTSRCNLRCIYCNPSGCCSEETLLSPPEIERLVRALAKLGINKVRLTGGEPLLRPDLEDIVCRVANVEGVEDICLTTNAQGLAERASALKSAGLMRVNISIDSLNGDRFRRISGGSLSDVMNGIDSVVRLGLPVKLNVVLIRGVNDDEVDAFIELARYRKLSVRFIELMPIGKLGESGDKKVPSSEIIARRKDLIPCPPEYPSQPSEDYTIEGFAGKIGFISPFSHKFCHLCNRVRITADGRFKPCLGDNGEVSLLEVLKGTDDELILFLKNAIYEKPKGHNFDEGFVSSRNMSDIGG